MAKEVKIEKLKRSDKRELIKLFVQAFSQFPLIPLQRFVPELSPEEEKVFIGNRKRAHKVSSQFLHEYEELLGVWC